MAKKLQGKVALITGSGRGIGRAVALKLASEGAKVVVNDLDAGPAHEVVTEIISIGSDAIAVMGDVTDSDFANRFVNTALERFGSIDIIVNNAGYTMDSMLHNMTDDSFDAMYAVHLKAPFQILRAASPFIISAAKKEAAEGREVFRKVVNITSVAGVSGNVGQANYSAMKSGLLGLTKTLAKEWGQYKVNVNCVGFGLIETRLTSVSDEKSTINVGKGQEIFVGIPAKIIDGIKQMIPFGRGGTTDEAAGAVYLMCIPESNYINGQILICGGGIAL